MSHFMPVELPRDPDALVFWLTTTLCAIFMLLVPGGAPSL